MSRPRHGINPELEEAADQILKESWEDSPDPEARALILTRYQLINRRNREIYTGTGYPDGALRRGTFGRALNPLAPHLNAVEGAGRPPSRIPAVRDTTP